MYVNERDQINYHGFLRALRKMNKVQQENVSIGICTVSGMNRFENGNRIAEKLMRDRLTARLGISGEKYEDYLQRKEYIRWQHRLRIVKAIEKRELHVAKEELDAYAKLRGLNVVNMQFVETMRFMILSLEDAPKDELLDCITKAVKWTVPNVENALNGTHLLSDQEINLIAEQMRLTPAPLAIADESAWRRSEYEKLITYIDNSHWEVLQKAKIYPKIVYYICKLLLEKETTEEEIRRGLELCHVAIELLRDTCRLYYFVELTEVRISLAKRLMNNEIEREENSCLEELIEKNSSWNTVVKKLYSEYKLESYISDFCFLYYETKCYDMAKVIETRRNMFDLSRVKLSKGICDERTIIRFEREGRNPSVETIRVLFDKLGLCAEYRRARVVTNDVEGVLLSTELVKFVNNHDVEGLEDGVELLKKKLCNELPYNRQEIIRNESKSLYYRGKLDKNEYYNKIKIALECTIPLELIEEGKELYLTKTEMECVLDLGYVGVGEKSVLCRRIIDEMYSDIIHNNMQVARISELELMTEHIESYLGNEKKYEVSTEISKSMIKECLTYKRMVNIATNLYNICWNQEQQLKNKDIVVDSKWLVDSLEICILLYDLIKENNTVAFFKKKLLNLQVES